MKKASDPRLFVVINPDGIGHDSAEICATRLILITLFRGNIWNGDKYESKNDK